MKAILLAAGLGSRLGILTKDIPKATVEVGSIPLINRVISFTETFISKDIIVIGGYNCEHLWQVIDDSRIRKIENPEYRKGNYFSLYCAREYLDDDFLIMNIDHLYPSHLARMIKETDNGIWAVVDFDRRLYQDDMKIRIDGNVDNNSHITAISKELEEFDGGYCGITIVRGPAIEDYKEAFNNVARQERDQAVVEDVLEELIRLNKPPRFLDISGIRWLEIDTQEDLANAERIIRMKPHFLD